MKFKVKDIIDAGNLSNLIPTKGSPKYITTICSNKGVPLIIRTYAPLNLLNITNFDVLINPTIIPSGIDNTNVSIKISKVTFNPSNTWGISPNT